MPSDSSRRPRKSLPPAVSSRSSGKPAKRKKNAQSPLPGILIAIAGISAVGGIAFAAYHFWTKSPPAGEAPASPVATAAATGGTSPQTAPAGSSSSGAAWSVRPDPAPNSPAPTLAPFPQDIVTAISTPKIRSVPGNQALALVEHSPGGGVSEFSVWDLTAGARRGKPITLDGPSADPSASPDGELILLRPIREVPSKDPQKGPRLSSEEIEIWSVRSSEKLRTIPAGDEATSLTLSEFIAPRTIATFCYVGLDQQRSMFLRLWNADTGAMTKEIPWTGYFQPKNIGFSPGGRYLATVDGFQPIPLRIFELETGSVVGAIPLPRQNSTGESWEWVTIAFSPDGARLAALRTSQAETEITVVDGATGAVLRTHKIPGQVYQTVPNSGAYQGPGLAWLPDGSGWLIAGGMIFDDAIGGPVLVTDGKDSAGRYWNTEPRRVFGDQLVYVSQVNAGTVEKTTSFRGLAIPWSEIRQPGASLPLSASFQ